MTADRRFAVVAAYVVGNPRLLGKATNCGPWATDEAVALR